MKTIIKQFLKFGIVGAFNTILGLVIFWIAVGLDVHYQVANIIGFVITVAISYSLNNIFSFRDKSKREVSWSLKGLLQSYLSYFITGIIINSVLLWLWIDNIGLDSHIAPIINLFVTVPLNFLMNKFWVFKNK